ncbi:MAG: cupin domain-containing protein [Salinirussus sp.]
MDAVNEANLDWAETDRGAVHFRRKRLAAATENEDLGCSLYELPSGKRGWPYHYHTGNAEAVYVIAGEGELRGPDDEKITLEKGTYVALPAGPSGAHRLRNTGDSPLRYLAFSTMNDPDVLRYPDSDKIGVMAGAPPGGNSDERFIGGFFPADATVDYWDGE